MSLPKSLSPLIRTAKAHLMLIGIIWLLLQSFLLLHFGIVTNFEATKYIEQADNLLHKGSYTSGNFLYYSTEILLIALCKKMGAGYWFVVVIQMTVNAFSVWCFYRLLFFFTTSNRLALMFSIAFLGMLYYQQYNVYLFTESLYFSLSVIYTYTLFQTKKNNFKNILILALLLTLLYFTRPVGLFFLPATALFLILKFYRKKALPIFSLCVSIGVLLFYLLLNNSLNSGGGLDFLLPYLNEQVICGVPTISNAHKIVVPGEKDSIEGLWYIVWHHRSLFFKLGLKRLIAFWGVVRPYYALVHNIFIAVYFYTLYCFILLGIRKMMQFFLPQVIFMLTIIFFTSVTVMLSCDEWHNRFFLALLPFFLLLANAPFLKNKHTQQ